MTKLNQVRIDDKLSLDLNKLKESDSHKTYYEFCKWAVDEYKNFMLISREDYKDTLNTIINNNGRFSKYAELLMSYIDNWGSVKSFFRVFSKEVPND